MDADDGSWQSYMLPYGYTPHTDSAGSHSSLTELINATNPHSLSGKLMADSISVDIERFSEEYENGIDGMINYAKIEIYATSVFRRVRNGKMKTWMYARNIFSGTYDLDDLTEDEIISDVVMRFRERTGDEVTARMLEEILTLS